MKKIYLSFFLAGIGYSVSAQFAQKPITANDVVRTAPKEAAKVPAAKALGTVIWSNDFSTTTDWVIDNDGQTGATYGWSIDAVRDGWWAPSSAIASVSEGNFAELTNGIYANGVWTVPQALDVVYTMTTAAPIPLSSTNVTLEFLQFGARFNDLQEIQVSTDGTTFFTVGDNLDKEVLSAAGGAAYSNPDLKSINLATLIPGATQLWLRFRWTTNFPSAATNPNVWVTYGWYIDDVTLTTNPDYDLDVVSSYWGTAYLNYYQIPLTQVAPIDFSANVFNGGTQTMGNAQLNVNINSGTWIGTSATGVNVPSLSDDSLFTTTQFTPSGTATATYSVTRSITTTEVDDVPANNTFPTLSFSTTNYIYARDNNTVAGNTSNGTDGFEVGNLFDIWADQTVKAINVRLLGGAQGTTVGTEIYATIYSIDPNTGDFVYEGASNPLTVASGNLNTNLVMQLMDPVNLLANNTYLAVVGSYGEGLKVANAGASEPQTSFFLDGADQTWYYTTSTPYVRLNFDPTVGIEETEGSVRISTVYPNPTSGATTLDYSLLNASDVKVEVVDITGKIVYTANYGTQVAGNYNVSFDASGYSNGVYYVNITSNESTVTTKFIKK
ncbi:MAG: T9SS type A sorting domain-containing protein [Flavobacteriia bacterium]